ncbi:MAG: type I polyketide synthase [Deltaproteobacteria bacterium]|nr:type I polyketide synthase [Deltaproteobacteria bacterium]
MDAALEQQYKTALRGARDTIRDLREQVRTVREPVAIIGMSCLFPGDEHGDADTPEAFGRLLNQGHDAVREIPPERAALWRSRHGADNAPRVPGLTHAALLTRDIFAFDRELFGQTPAEAAMTDPQHRLLLELSWQAVLDAGLTPSALAGSGTGIFAGKTGTDYLFDLLGTGRASADDPYTMTGNMHSTLPGRLAHFYDCHGPCVSAEAACATSLVAVMQAVNSLRAGECSLALAGAANLLLGPTPSHWLNAMHSLAPDGRCKAFGAGADGFGRGEGGGVVVLERLSDALRNGRRVHAVLLGGAIGSDGKTPGFTAPSAKGQRLVMTRALANAGLRPEDVGFVETHGTGTPLGDPIEVESLAQVYGQRTRPLLIGAVKSNIAHLEAASGMAGLIKTVLAVRDGVIPASLHCTPPNSLLDWDAIPVRVAAATQPWPEGHARRVAGIDSFAISGTLAHLLVAEPPTSARTEAATAPDCRVLALSARGTEGLAALAARCARRLEEGESLAAMCAAATLRPLEPERLALAVADSGEAVTGLRAFGAGTTRRGVAKGRRETVLPSILFLFSGQGSQQAGMGRALDSLFPVFRDVLERCDALAAPRLGYSLREVMFAADDPRLHDTRCTQPVIYTHQAALAAVWRECGVLPTAVFGHSIGEYAAAHVAGVFDLETGLDIALTRGELAASIRDQGAMAAVLASEAEVMAELADLPGVAVAAVNGPATVTIAGARDEVDEAVRRLRAKGLESRPLPVSHAFHCPLIEPMLDRFETFLRGLRFAAPRIPILSGCTGEHLGPDVEWPAYFRAQTRQPVRFSDALRRAGESVFLELGASPTLTSYGRQCREDGIWLFSASAGAGMKPMAQSLARLHALGFDLTWRWQMDEAVRPEAMPPYPFERERLVPEFALTAPQPPISTAENDAAKNSSNALGNSDDAAVRLAMLQCEAFQRICAMQQSFFGVRPENGGQGE